MEHTKAERARWDAEGCQLSEMRAADAGVVCSKGIYYFPTEAAVHSWAIRSGWESFRAVSFERGWGCQAGPSGSYAGLGPNLYPRPWRGGE